MTERIVHKLGDSAELMHRLYERIVRWAVVECLSWISLAPGLSDCLKSPTYLWRARHRHLSVIDHMRQQGSQNVSLWDHVRIDSNNILRRL